MAIDNCFKKLGKSLNDKDKSAIKALMDSGLDEDKAVDVYSAQLSAEINDLKSHYQKGDEGDPRGSISLFKDDRRIIRLGEASDQSTIPHEFAHLFLEVEKQLAMEFGYTNNQRLLLNWLGVSSFNDIKPNHHEKFAETFEQYLEQGKAPSPALRDAFSNFRTWISNVYKIFRSDPRTLADLNDTSRFIFDRMLASEEEIDQMMDSPDVQLVFQSAGQAGMTQGEFEEYQQSPKRIKTRSQEMIDRVIMDQVRKRKTQEWREEKSFLVDEEINRLSTTAPYMITEAVKTSPMQLDLLREHMGIDAPTMAQDRGKPLKTDTLLVAAAKQGGLNRDAWTAEGIDPATFKNRSLNNQIVGYPVFPKNGGMTPDQLAGYVSQLGFGENLTDNDVVELVMKEIRGEPVRTPEGTEILLDLEYQDERDGLSKKQLESFVKKIGRKNGADPEVYAEFYGYDSVEDMIRDIMDLKPIRQAAEESAEQLMIDKYGDILKDGTIEREVEKSVHSEEQGRKLLSEIKALGRKMQSPDMINRSELRAKAKEMIANMRQSEIKPGRYYRAAMNAAKEAGEAESDQDKRAAKVKQLANHYLYREALEAREVIDRRIRYIRKYQTNKWKTGEVSATYQQMIKLVANMYDARKETGEPKTNEEVMSDVMKILGWYQGQDPDYYKFGNILDFNLLDVLAEKERVEQVDPETNKRGMFNPGSYRFPKMSELNYDQIEGVYQQLKHFRYVGGKEAESVNEAEAELRAELEKSVLDNGGANHPDRKGVPRKYTNLERQAAAAKHKLKSLLNMIRQLDNDFKDDNGLMFKHVWLRMEEGKDTEMRLHGEMYDLMKDELKDMYKLHLTRKPEKYTLLDGREIEMSSESRFMLAMYWGTETSRQAIRDAGFADIDGEAINLTDADVMNILSTMSPSELGTVNQMWKINEHLWPELRDTVIRQEGVAPPKLEAAPFTINGINMSGGHQTLFYDSIDIEVKDAEKKANTSAKIAPTKAAAANARVGSGGRPVLLSLTNITKAMDDNIHYIAWADIGSDLRSLVDSKTVRAAIEKKHGVGFHEAFKEQISSITAGKSSSSSIKLLETTFRHLRGAATARHLMYSVRNTVQQFSAIPIAMQEVGINNYLEATRQFTNFNDMREIVSLIDEKSAFMKERATYVNREASENINRLTLENSGMAKMWRTFMDYGFAPQTFVDSLIAYPVWWARYRKAMEEHGDDKKAISQANTSVAESVGSGSDLHLSGWFQSTTSEFEKSMTMFGSWFGGYYQRMVRDTENFTTVNSKQALYTLVTTPFISGVMAAALIMDTPDDEDSLWEWWKWGGMQGVKFLGGTVPVVRDIVGYWIGGFPPKTVLAEGIAAPSKVGQAAAKYSEGEWTGYKTASAVIKSVGTVVKLPGSGTVTRPLDYLDSAARGREEGGSVPGKFYQSFVEGSNKN